MILSVLLFYNIGITNRIQGFFGNSKHGKSVFKNANLYLVRQNGSVQIEESGILEKVHLLEASTCDDLKH